jgi:glycerophosphoryl diester phosphodiesterase
MTRESRGTWLAPAGRMSHAMTVLAHRGNVNGPSGSRENGLRTIRHALECGWGIELDLRRAANGQFYVAHDRQLSAVGLEADPYCALFRRFPKATIAINVKELGYEAALVGYLEKQLVMAQSFLFDMDLLEAEPGATASLFRRLHPSVRLATRVSDRREPLERALEQDVAGIVWLDEFDRLWATERDVCQLKEAGRTVYAVSPELHGFSLGQARSRWIDFIQWGVDGVCTDYPDALERTLAETVSVSATAGVEVVTAPGRRESVRAVA